MRTTLLIVIAGLSLTAAAPAQTSATIAAVGYSAPSAHIPVASGQVVTLFLRGVGPLPDGTPRNDSAVTTPLPYTLAGISARVANTPLRIPFFFVRQESDCPQGESVVAACLLTSVRVEMPFELGVEVGLTWELVLDVDGQPSRSFVFETVADQSHVLTSCDVAGDTSPFSSCRRLLSHANGSAVTESAPAVPGETVIVYAWGLGLTSPVAPTGTPAPSASPLRAIPGLPSQPVLRARFLAKVLPFLAALPPYFSQEDANDPGSPIAFAGLAPGQIGMYQINTAVPQSFNVAASCGDGVRANAVLHITTASGTEEVPFCFQQ